MSLLGVRLGALNMTGTADSDGDIFAIGDVVGLDSADIDYQRSDKASDGGYLDSLRAQRRELTIQGTGYSRSSDAAGLLRVRQKIEDAFALCFYSPTNVYFDFASPGHSVQLSVRVGGKLHFATPHYNVQQFEIPLSAEDPRKYSQVLHSTTVGSATTIQSLGNATTYLIATLPSSSGSVTPYLQNATPATQRLNFTGPMAAGTAVDFFARRSYDAGGTAREYTVMPRSWFGLVPGNNQLSATPSWSVVWRDAWL